MTELVGRNGLQGRNRTWGEILVLSGSWAFRNARQTAVATGVAPERFEAHDGRFDGFASDMKVCDRKRV